MKYFITLVFLLFAHSLFSATIELVNSSDEKVYASYEAEKYFEENSITLSPGISKSLGFSAIDGIGPNILWRTENDKKIKSFPIDQKYLKAKFTDIHFVYLGNDQWCFRLYNRNKKFKLESCVVFNQDKAEVKPVECNYVFSYKNKDWIYVELQVDDIQIQKIGLLSSISKRRLLLDFSTPKKKIKFNIKKENKEYEASLDLTGIDCSGKTCLVENDGEFIYFKIYKEHYSSRETLVLDKKIPIIEKVEQKKE